jgi:hypothetical protein
MHWNFNATFCLSILAGAWAGCVTTPPSPHWTPAAQATEGEYQPYLIAGTGSVTGQAYLPKRVGGFVTAPGTPVTLDPATSVGNEWWEKAGQSWLHRSLTPPSPAFAKARRTTVTGADGKFTFSNLPAGKYYVRTEVTWKVGNYDSFQGGLVGQVLEVRDGQSTEVILSKQLE